MAFARLWIHRPFPKIIAIPLHAPLAKHAFERLFVCLGLQVYYILEFPVGFRIRMFRDILAHGLLLVELAQLHLLVRKHLREAFPSVKHYRGYLIPHAFELGYTLRIKGVGLVLYEVPQQIPTGKGILE